MSKTNPTSKVFVTNFQSRDYSSAEKYGELVFVTKGFIVLSDLEKIRKSLSRFIELSSADDYVILMGPSVIIAMFTVLWFAKHGYMNILSWDGKNNTYNHYVVGVDKVNVSH